MKIAVVGAGAWGTALANVLCHNQHEVTLWAHDATRVQEIHETKRNERYLPGIVLSPALTVESDLQKSVANCDFIVVAVPSKAFREVTSQLYNFAKTVVSVTKGIEFESGLTMSGVLHQTMPKSSVAALSGPTLAFEVARNVPAACVIAAENNDVAKTIQTAFVRPAFRVYTSTDLMGVELGGALKNVIALAAGMSDGLEFGDNAKAALITRGIVEISRLGVASGAKAETFSGLSGLGDLTVTCFSKLSRNRNFGEKLGRGAKIPDILKNSITVAEGYPTTRSAYQLAKKLKVETPIINEIYAMLYEGKHIGQAVLDLMSRDAKPEIAG